MVTMWLLNFLSRVLKPRPNREDSISLFEPTPSIYGRGDEIEEIFEHVVAHSFSVTIVCGPSGVGKSTLLRELQVRLSGPNSMTGFHEIGDPQEDPVLYCLSDVLRSAGIARSVSQLAGLRGLDGRDFGDIANSLATRAAPLIKLPGMPPGLGLLLDMVKLSLGNFGSLKQKTPSTKPQIFESTVSALRSKSSDARIILFIDNLERSVAQETWRLIEHALRHQEILRPIHVVGAWKTTPENSSAFDAISRTLREYGSFTKQLAPLPDETVENWLHSKVPAFRSIPLEERSRIVAGCAGLPAVVEGLVVALKDENRLISEASSVVAELLERRYLVFDAWLENESASRVVYLLAKLRHPSSRELTTRILNMDGPAVGKVLGDLVRLGLLREVKNHIEFTHETKRDYALKKAETTLGNGALTILQSIYRFYVDTACPEDPASEEFRFFEFAASVSRSLTLPPVETQLLAHAAEFGAPKEDIAEHTVLPIWQESEVRSVPLGIQMFACSRILRDSARDVVSSKAVQILVRAVLQDPNRRSRPEGYRCALVTAALACAKLDDELEFRFAEELIDLGVPECSTTKSKFETNVVLSGLIVARYVARSVSEQPSCSRLPSVVKYLNNLVDQSSSIAILRRMTALDLVHLTRCALACGDFDSGTAFVGLLRDLRAADPSDHEVADAFSLAISSLIQLALALAAIGKKGTVRFGEELGNLIGSLMVEAGGIQDQFPDIPASERVLQVASAFSEAVDGASSPLRKHQDKDKGRHDNRKKK